MTSWADWARGKGHVALGAAALAAACSFQDFEYLQVPEITGGSGGSSGSAGSSSGGSSGDAGSGTGGTSGSPTGGTGGSEPTGGKGGSSSGTGGTGGTAGSAGGAGGEAGDETGGTSTGGTGGTGAVGALVNPSFETNNMMGWTIDPPEAVSNRWIYTQAPTGSVPAPNGSYELATWHGTSAYHAEIFQKVTGLEDGTYTFSAFFSWGMAIGDIYLFARDCGGTDPDPFPIPSTPADSFVQVSMTGIDVAGGSCEVGLYVEGAANAWMNADMFSLELE